MERILKGLQPENVFYYFEEISRIPRGSGNERAISNYLVHFAKSRGFMVIQDDSLNVIIDKPASPGYEKMPKIMLQGHMDMVCEKDPEVQHNFIEDPIPLVIDGEYLRSEGTTLGADDGNALALILSILDNKEISLPAIQAIFTSREEIGLIGAMELSPDSIDGDYLIGLDYSQDNNILVSSAGSASSLLTLSAEKIPLCSNKKKAAFKIEISGLTSGHSGIEIIKRRANANKLLGEILSELSHVTAIELSSIWGGDNYNVIPSKAHAIICFDKKDKFTIQQKIAALSEIMFREYKENDPNIKITGISCDLPEKSYSQDVTKKLILLLDIIPDGLQNYMDEDRKISKCSVNLGVVREADKGITLMAMARSNSEYQLDQLLRRINNISTLCEVAYTLQDRSPVWEYAPSPHLISYVQDVWEALRGIRPPVNIIHASVETGIIIKKMQEKCKAIEAINLGVKNYDVHTTRERMEIASIGRTYELLIKILEGFPEK